MKSNKRATLKDISKACDVSVPTISGILNGSSNNSRCSEETRKRVLAAATKLNYRPNRQSRMMAKARHGSVGIVCQNIFSITEDTLHAMLEIAAEHDQTIVFDQVTPSSVASKFLKEDSVDGLIVFEDLNEMLVDQIDQSGIPSVFVNCSRRDIPNAITFDEFGGARKGMKILAERERRAPALLSHVSKHYSRVERLAGMASFCKEHDLIAPAVLDLPGVVYPRNAEAYRARIKEFLDAYPQIDSIIISGAQLALLLEQVLRDLGRNIPDHLSLICFGHDAALPAFRPALTTVIAPRTEVGKKAIQLVNRIINGDELDAPVIIDLEITERESV